MRAKDYFKAFLYDYKNKDALGLTNKDICDRLAEKFATEVDEQIESGVITTADQLVAALTERNEKWMALARIFKNHFGDSPIDKGYFRRKVIPEKWPYATGLVAVKSCNHMTIDKLKKL